MGRLIRFPGPHRASSERAWAFDGLRGLAIVVEDLDEDADDAGIVRTNVQVRVESAMKRHEIPIVPLADLETDPGTAVLYVAIGACRHGSAPVALHLSLQVCESAMLSRDPDKFGGVTTWQVNGVWLTDVDSAADILDEAIDDGIERLGEDFGAG